MNEQGKEQWIEGVITSMEGSQRAKPSVDLFSKIEAIIEDAPAKVIPFSQLKVAAAVAILVLNIFVLRHALEANQSGDNDIAMDSSSSQHLISNYNIYK